MEEGILAKQLTVICFAGMAFLATSSAALAVPILSAVSATASSTYSGYPIENTINQSGLSTGFTSGVTDFDAYLATNPTHTYISSGFEWFSAEGVTDVTLTFDLGAVYSVGRMALWNEEYSGIPTFNVLSSVDGISYSSVASGLTTVDSPSVTDYLAQVFNLGIGSARYIRLETSDCPQAGGEGHVGCGLGEIAFAPGTPSVPEPAALALLASGLCAVSLRARRRRA